MSSMASSIAKGTARRAEAQVLRLMHEAVRRANGGRQPGEDELKARSRVEEEPISGQVLVRWDGQLVLVLSPSATGLGWEFMGAAAAALPADKAGG